MSDLLNYCEELVCFNKCVNFKCDKCLQKDIHNFDVLLCMLKQYCPSEASLKKKYGEYYSEFKSISEMKTGEGQKSAKEESFKLIIPKLKQQKKT